MGGFNGLALSPDEKFIDMSSGGKIARYDIQADDTLANRKTIIDVGSDGMRVDAKGNLSRSDCSHLKARREQYAESVNVHTKKKHRYFGYFVSPDWL